ncbi:MAG: hypothetical protein A3F68_08090 [Acidobacteria bacterium RIFCSPLOWO2_12_FULL_54_10]|nr:MAG: hypothetical protein A3F68_08090 [Acidobacteria bacterium RIFCSPLOWO2_12_FULL_54_10]
MDTITHGIAGALVAKSFISKREGRLVTWAVTFGSVFPDSDAFANFFISDRLARLEVHRGITHSLLALPFFALLLGVLTCLVFRRRGWPLLSLFYGIGIALHIMLDVVTSFGTMIWQPWSNVRVAWDSVFIIDLTLSTIVLLPQLLPWVYAEPRRMIQRALLVWMFFSGVWAVISFIATSVQIAFPASFVAVASLSIAILLCAPLVGNRGFRWPARSYCRAGLAAFGCYLVLCALAHRAALAQVDGFIQKAGLKAEYRAALPAPPSLLFWSGLVKSSDGIYRVPIQLGSSAPPSFHFFAHAGENQYLQNAEMLASVKTYRWFARFPWVTYRHMDGLHIVDYQDIQFFGPFRGENSPFTYRVSFDDSGRVVSSALLGP